MKKILGKASAVLAAFVLAGTVAAAPAQADPINPNPARPARTWTPPPVKRTWHPTTVRVTPGMTLWRVAVTCYGYKYAYPEKAGHLWPTVAKRNHVKGTTIYTGQILSC